MVGVSEMVKFVCIFVIFVPCHAGVRGNVRVDRLAGTAVVSDGRAIDHSDVLHALLEAVRVKEPIGDFDSETMERLKDGQVKLCAASYEHYAGSQRQIVNQMRTGTLNHDQLWF
jgi:hypothetical protein